MKLIKILSLLIITLFTVNAEDTLRVDVAGFPPLIIEEEGQLKGLEIDMWNEIARENGYVFQYNKVEKFANVFDGLKDGTADVALAGITINSERESFVDFTHNHISTGLGVMYEKNTIWQHIGIVIKANLKFYGSLILNLVPFVIAWILYVYIIAAILWKLELGNEMFHDEFYKGWADAKFFVHVVISSTGFGNQIPMSTWGKRIAIILMYSGIGFMFPLITGKITSEFSKKPEIHYIEQISDLEGKRVAVIESSTSIGFVRKVGGEINEVKDIFEARLSLKAGDVDAVVFDRPALLYMAHQDDDLHVIEETFNVEDYGIAVQSGSPLLEILNQSVLKMKENGKIDSLKDKWF